MCDASYCKTEIQTEYCFVKTKIISQNRSEKKIRLYVLKAIQNYILDNGFFFQYKIS